jgi:hypothetical protein
VTAFEIDLLDGLAAITRRLDAHVYHGVALGPGDGFLGLTLALPTTGGPGHGQHIVAVQALKVFRQRLTQGGIRS